MTYQEDLENHLSCEQEQRGEHLDRVFDTLGDFAARYTRGCPKRDRQNVVREMMEYLLVEFPAERDFPVINIGKMYFEEAVRLSRRDGMPLNEAYEILKSIAKKCSNTAPEDALLVESKVCEFIEKKFPEHPKLRRELREFYSSVKEEFVGEAAA